MIDCQNVCKYYGKIKALDHVSFKIKDGEFVSLVGPSGAGKTTFVRLLICEERPTSGRILVDNRDIHLIPKSETPFYRRQLGVVFQDYKLLPTKTVYENVAYALEVIGASAQMIKDRVAEVLELVGLETKAKNYPRELSGGEQQRTSLARALVHQPKILIADEPTGNLDPITSGEIINLLLKINQRKTTVILATHSREVVNALRKRVIGFKEGRLVYDKEQGSYFI